MFKIITTLTMTLAAALLQAQVKETRNASDFSKLHVTDGIEVTIIQAGESKMEVEAATASALGQIRTEIKNNTLTLSSDNPDLKAKITLYAQQFSIIKADDRSIVYVKGELYSNDLAITVSSGSKFNGNVSGEKIQLLSKNNGIYNIRLNAKHLTGNFRNGSRANISGFAASANLMAGNRSLCHARNLSTNKVSIDAREDATILIAAQEELDIRMSETSNVTYYGKPGKVTLPENATAKYKSAGDRMLSEN